MHKIKTSISSRGHIQKPIKSLPRITKPRHIFKLPTLATGSHPLTELWGLQRHRSTQACGVQIYIDIHAHSDTEYTVHVHSFSSLIAYIINDAFFYLNFQ